MTSLGLRLLDLAIAAVALVYLVRPQDFLGSRAREGAAGGRVGDATRRVPSRGDAPEDRSRDAGDDRPPDRVPTVGFVDRSVLFGEPAREPSLLEPGRVLGLVVVVLGLALASGAL